MFDMEKVKADSGLEAEQLTRIEERVRADYEDEMLFELHFVRVIRALKEGTLTLDHVLTEPLAA